MRLGILLKFGPFCCFSVVCTELQRLLARLSQGIPVEMWAAYPFFLKCNLSFVYFSILRAAFCAKFFSHSLETLISTMKVFLFSWSCMTRSDWASAKLCSSETFQGDGIRSARSLRTSLCLWMTDLRWKVQVFATWLSDSFAHWHFLQVFSMLDHGIAPLRGVRLSLALWRYRQSHILVWKLKIFSQDLWDLINS